jgi:hypothetical protein
VIEVEDIDKTLRNLGDAFLNCYESGHQARDLAPINAGAFGQSLDQPASSHRGLHGTAAGLRVLASLDRPDARRATQQIVHYLAHRVDLERTVGSGEARDDNVKKALLDEHNVIKASEVLYALRFVDARVQERNALAERIATRLQDGIIGSTGWSYFLDDQGSAQLLPTAYAVRALDAHGYDVRQPVQHLMRQLASEAGRQTDTSVQVACIWVLSFRSTRPTGADEAKLKAWLTRLWRRLEPLLAQDLETNIEYSRRNANYYVRVPWQLYLICTAARLDPYRKPDSTDG